jgi:hypothetical protein
MHMSFLVTFNPFGTNKVLDEAPACGRAERFLQKGVTCWWLEFRHRQPLAVEPNLRDGNMR